MNTTVKTILVSPLDWGLGHGSRLIPVTGILLERGYRIILAGSGNSLTLLKSAFPSLETIWLPSPKISYSAGSSQVLSILLRLPRMFFVTLREQRILKKLLHNGNIDMVVSDNRYGLYAKHIHTVIITHQLSPLLPKGLKYLEYPVHRLIRKMTDRFTECWIPDDSGGKFNLTGFLSARFPLPANAIFTGILSAPAYMQRQNTIIPSTVTGNLSDGNDSKPESGPLDVLLILSGPEPQKSIFLGKVIQSIGKSTFYNVYVAGGYAARRTALPGNFIFSNFEGASEMNRLISNRELIICRPGYSVIMELLAAGRPAILVPTPGQPEQEYLGKRLDEEGYFMTTCQNNPDLQGTIRIFRKRLEKGGFRKYNGGINKIPALPV